MVFVVGVGGGRDGGPIGDGDVVCVEAYGGGVVTVGVVDGSEESDMMKFGAVVDFVEWVGFGPFL